MDIFVLSIIFVIKCYIADPKKLQSLIKITQFKFKSIFIRRE